MRLATPFRDLGRVPVRGLRLWARDAPEAVWAEDALRQERFRVHAQTQSVILCWTDHADFPVLHTRPWPRWAAFGPALAPVLARARAATGAAGRLCTAMLARLPAGARIPRHVDVAPFFGAARRFHVPLVTAPGVRFEVDGAAVPMPAAHLIELDNRRPHGVDNESDRPRVHLIFDILDQPLAPVAP